MWEAMQTELHQLFAELLDAPALTAHTGPAAPSGNDIIVACDADAACGPAAGHMDPFLVTCSTMPLPEGRWALMLREVSTCDNVGCVAMFDS